MGIINISCDNCLDSLDDNGKCSCNKRKQSKRKEVVLVEKIMKCVSCDYYKDRKCLIFNPEHYIDEIGNEICKCYDRRI